MSMKVFVKNYMQTKNETRTSAGTDINEISENNSQVFLFKLEMTDRGPRGTFVRWKNKVNQYYLCQCHVTKMDTLLVHMKYACLSKSQAIICMCVYARACVCTCVVYQTHETVEK